MAAPLRLNEFIEVLTKIKEEHGDVLVGHYGNDQYESVYCWIKEVDVEAYKKDEPRVVLGGSWE